MAKPMIALMVALACAACTRSGIGRGVLVAPSSTTAVLGDPRGPVTFTWKARGDVSDGKIAATLPDGRRYSGTFVQMTAATRYDTYGPYWTWWRQPWWGPWGPGFYGPSSQFATHYAGKVLAYLMGSDGSLMRCRFLLRWPLRGVAGGGQGECQLSTGEKVFGVNLARAS